MDYKRQEFNTHMTRRSSHKLMNITITLPGHPEPLIRRTTGSPAVARLCCHYEHVVLSTTNNNT